MGLTRPRYSSIQDTDYKQSVRVATTADVGNLLATSNMTNSVDGVTVAVNDRILVKDQNDLKQNGIYFVINAGSGSNGTWRRSLDADASYKVTSGMTTTVTEGNTNVNKTFKLTTLDPITLGTSELSFVNPFNISATAAGANTYVQFYDTGSMLGGSPGFTFEKTNNFLNVGGNVSIGGALKIFSANSSPFSTDDAVYIQGGVTTVGNIASGGRLVACSFAKSTNINSGAIQTNGGIGAWGNIIAGENVVATGNVSATYFIGDGSNLTGIDATAIKNGENAFVATYSNGNVTVKGNLVPSANVVYDLGTSTLRWKDSWFSGNVYATTLYGNIGGGSALSNVYITGSLIPTANVEYDLGTPTQKFRSAYFSGNTVYIGSESISVASNGTWTFSSAGGSVALGASAVFNPPTVATSGNITVGEDLIVNGRLFVSGNSTVISTNNIVLNDSLIYLANGNPTDFLDIGTVGNFTRSSLFQHTGFARDATDGVWKLFEGVEPVPTTTIDFGSASYSTALVGNLVTRSNITVGGNIRFGGALLTSAGLGGDPGQYLTSTGTGIAWTTLEINNTIITDATNSSNVTATSNYVDVWANGTNSAIFYNDIAYIYTSLTVSNEVSAASVSTTGNVTAGNLSVAGIVGITSTAASTSTSTGALTVAGGVGIAGNLYAGNVNATNLSVGGILYTGSTGYNGTINAGSLYLSDYQLAVEAGDLFVASTLMVKSNVNTRHNSLGVGTAASGTSGEIRASTISLDGGGGGAQLNLRSGGDLVIFNAANSGSISVYCDTNGELLVNGNHRISTSLGVGTAPSGVTGEIRATNEITAYYSSDERLKENVVVIDNALGKLQQLRGVMFDWKQEIIDERGGEDGFFVRKHDTGIIAQEVEAVLPEVVATREDGYKAVKYEKLAGLIIQAINELAGEVAEIKRRIE